MEILEVLGHLDPPEMPDSPEPLASPEFVETLVPLGALERTVLTEVPEPRESEDTLEITEEMEPQDLQETPGSLALLEKMANLFKEPLDHPELKDPLDKTDLGAQQEPLG